MRAWFSCLVMVACGGAGSGEADVPWTSEVLSADPSPVGRDVTLIGSDQSADRDPARDLEWDDAAPLDSSVDEAAMPDIPDGTGQVAESVADAPMEAWEPVPGGPVALSGVANARAIGTLPAGSGRHVRPGVLIRSGDLSGLDETGCEQFEALGIRSIVDLRTAAEAEATPDAACALGLAAYHLAGLPKILPPSADSYRQTLEAACPALPGIFARLAAADGLPAILHCVIGRDRAGIAMAVVLLSLGVPGPEIIADFVNNQDYQVSAEWMQAVLDRIGQAGGTAAFLASCGVDPAHVSALEAAALQ